MVRIGAMSSIGPNILLIVIDDLGWNDLACYGSGFYETPALDRLAGQGMRFTDAYASCPVCSPSRASIMTGKYPATIGITDWIDWGGRLHPARGRVIDVPYLKELPPREHTIARALKARGYATWHVGKWHLGGPASRPEDHGFDVNVGGCEAGCPSTYFAPWKICTLPDAEVPAGTYLTDHLTDRAIDLIEQRDPDQPFFMNLWHYSVHTPLQAPEPLVQKYRDKARAMGLDRVKVYEEGEYFPCDHKRNQRVIRRRIQSDPVYAAMIENLDTNLGRVLAALETAGIADNTLVVFTSDNGGLATAEGSPTCNAPLTEGKGWMYEGGTRVCQIVRWPGRVAPGLVCAVPVTSPDLYPTLLDVAGGGLLPEQPVDGVSLLPVLTGTGELHRDAIFWHYPHYGNQGGTPGCSVRMGDFKLIERFEDGCLELYDLRSDVEERHNLASADPDRAATLHKALVEWRGKVEAKMPVRNPDYRRYV